MADTITQSEELFEVIQLVKSSGGGKQALQSIFQEANSTGAGKGDIIIKDYNYGGRDAMTQFCKDHKQYAYIKSTKLRREGSIECAYARMQRVK